MLLRVCGRLFYSNKIASSTVAIAEKPCINELLKIDITNRLAHTLSPSHLPKPPAPAIPSKTTTVLEALTTNRFSNTRQLTRSLEQLCTDTYRLHGTDTGSPEVQCAIWTCRMHALRSHITAHPHDYNSQRRQVALVHRRFRMLKWLRGCSLERYHELLDVLALPHNYVEGFEDPYKFRYRKRTRAFKPVATCIRTDFGKLQRATPSSGPLPEHHLLSFSE